VKRKRKGRVLLLYLSTRTGVRGMRLWRTDREVARQWGSLRLGAVADWEAELLADRAWGRLFAW